MDLLQTVRKEGSRGGRAEFKWEDVKNDAQRENYLGHSLMAPVGRWQQNKDLTWYAKGDAESKEAEAARIKEEKRKLKEAEEDAMLAAMGLPVPVRNNANLTPLGERAHEADVKEAIEEKAKDGDGEDRAKRREKKDRSRRHRDDGDRTAIAQGLATGGEMVTKILKMTSQFNPGDACRSELKSTSLEAPPETSKGSNSAYAHPEKVLSLEELYEVRFLTSFLFWTKTIDSDSGETKQVEGGNGDKTTSDVLTALTHVFVRKDELVALTTKDALNIRACFGEYDDYAESDAKDDDDDLNDGAELESLQADDGSKEAALIASTNVREVDRFHLEIPRFTYPPLDIEILPSISKIAEVDSMTTWLLSRTTDRLNSGHPKTDITFQEHIGNVMTLIKDIHESEEAGRPDTLGTEDRDLFKYTTLTGTKVKAASRGITPTFVECLEYIPRERDEVCRALTETELLILINVVHALKAVERDEVHAADLCRATTWKDAQANHESEVLDDVTIVANRLASLKRHEEFRFDAEFMVLFQSVIAGVVMNVRHSLEDLMFWKKHTQLNRQRALVEESLENDDFTTMANDLILAVGMLVDRAGEWLRVLHTLTQTLRPFAKTNFRCLREFYDLKNSMPGEQKVQKQSPPRPGPSVEPSNPRTPTTPSKTGAPQDASPLVEMMESSPAPEGFQPPGSEGTDDLAEAIDKMEVDEKDRHDPYDKRVSEIMLHAKVSLVKATMPFKDEQLFIKKFLDDFVMPTGKELTPEQIDKIVKWTKVHGRGLSYRHLNPASEMKMFTGTYHCETVMLVLFLLEMFWDEIVDPEPNLDSEDPSYVLNDSIGKSDRGRASPRDKATEEMEDKARKEREAAAKIEADTDAKMEDTA
ncbi:hypothetical protein E8E12_006674 [Didymella heteroderae]|uniref:Multiple myeloma tumor-associated protein 2-like N-terminal domain-containing protein n=1 Tax=Didymella heteroderae TaxID=1769908 RepID=A0A9P4WK67_9PLEO|nr:hypothetical protein E8E12_006674 [Didymella heteroderae]